MSTARILFLDQTGQVGGAELSLLDLVNCREKNSEVVLFSDGPLVQMVRDRCLKVTVMSAGQAMMAVGRNASSPGLTAAWELGVLVTKVARRARAFDIIHCNTQKAFVVGALAGWLARRPTLYHLRDLLTADHFSAFNRKVAVSLANRFAAKVLANSAATRDAFILAGGNPKLVEVLHNGIDPRPYLEAQPVPGLRKRLGVGTVPLFGSFSRLAPWKGQHVLLEALAQVPQAHLLIVGEALFGEDEYATRLHRQVEELGLEKRVHFLGHRSDVAALMKSVDGIVHTSIAPEPFGRAIVEGMLAGKPVVATKGGGVLEILQDGETGRLVNPGDPGDLAAVLKNLCDFPDAGIRLGQAAQAEALVRFTVTEMNRRFDEIIREITQGLLL